MFARCQLRYCHVRTTKHATLHFAVLALLFRLHQSTFTQGQAIAALSAMMVDFAINNVLTYLARQLLGSRWWRGWLTFAVICGAEGLLNVGVFLFT
jgi:dolichol-phosphate mannosyltransferase